MGFQKWLRLCAPIFLTYFWRTRWCVYLQPPTVKLGDKKWLDCEQPGNSKPFSVTKLPVYFTNNEQPCVSEQFCNDQKFPYFHVSFAEPPLIPVIMKSDRFTQWNRSYYKSEKHIFGRPIIWCFFCWCVVHFSLPISHFRGQALSEVDI